jgi:DNA-binding transcriptional LysR family regulator
VRASLRAGAGIGPLPTFYAQEDVRAGHLVNVIPDWSEVPATLYFVYPATRHLPRKVAALRDLLAARLSTQLG